MLIYTVTAKNIIWMHAVGTLTKTVLFMHLNKNVWRFHRGSRVQVNEVSLSLNQIFVL